MFEFCLCRMAMKLMCVCIYPFTKCVSVGIPTEASELTRAHVCFVCCWFDVTSNVHCRRINYVFFHSFGLFLFVFSTNVSTCMLLGCSALMWILHIQNETNVFPFTLECLYSTVRLDMRQSKLFTLAAMRCIITTITQMLGIRCVVNDC